MLITESSDVALAERERLYFAHPESDISVWQDRPDQVADTTNARG